MEMLTGINVRPKLTAFHTFGWPVYQLTTELQNSKKIPKWDPRCKLGLYLGNSSCHSRSVSNVINLQTGRVSPQFYVQHDEFFETIAVKDNTLVLSRFSKVNKIYKDLDLPSVPVTSKQTPTLSTHDQDMSSTILLPDLDFVLPLEEHPNIEPPVEQPHEPPPLLRRATRRKESTRVLLENISQQGYDFQEFRKSTYIPQTVAFSSSKERTSTSSYEALHEDDYKLQDLLLESIAFSAAAEKDTMYYSLAMRAPDKAQFKTVMKKEFNDHNKRKYW